MDIETSLAQQYHKMGMKCSPATRPDSFLGQSGGSPKRRLFFSYLL